MRDLVLVGVGALLLVLFHHDLTGHWTKALAAMALFALVGAGMGGVGERFLLWLIRRLGDRS
ncbi:MAG: hypothetical protein NZ959_03960 [Armatimonadetes bacterium]|nr:hypothetical protein [Armatimonadota bacterium]MDW8122379.1 hypothetical protein [Armatimonadota bacterium]